MRPAIAAPALALLCACAGGYTPDHTLLGDGNGISPGTTGGDGGSSDAGDAGQDAGHDGGSDAGCTALLLPTTGIIDYCSNPSGVAVTGSVSTTNCYATVNGPATGPCIGTVSGTHDAFSGYCGGFSPCVSTALPGNIVCATSSMTSCTITVCNGDC